MAARRLSGLAFLLSAVTTAAPSLAAIEKQGEWPADEKKVSLDVERVPQEDAIKRLAEAAGWSVVLHAPSTEPASLHVKDQPADKVLSLLLEGGDYVARRDGTLISISRAPAAKAAEAAPAVPPVPPTPAVPPVPPAPPVPPNISGDAPAAKPENPGAHANKGEGKDREVVGQNLVIEKDEVVRNVHLIGGTLTVKGVVTGDVEVAGGMVSIEPGAHVMGDAQVMGGSLNVKKGARLDGDARIVGGKLDREEGAVVAGDVSTRIEEEKDDEPTNAQHIMREFSESMTGGALLFALGAVLIALFTKRAESLKVEIAARPMRSFALGIVGSLGAVALLAALCITLVGIPVAVVGLLAGTFGVFAAMCSVLEVVGRALIGHKTKNEYAHLALGCALFVLTSPLPVIGGLVRVVVVLVAIGSLVATRAAGLVPAKKGAKTIGDDSHPYRSAEVV
ncbi:polymer-forming cytoskeletal protein [Polyangium sp. 15x6]|uniref:polymer-forming cytoskeletal protein n=1 Tax=Polyangium sp. 15x6 TaxID=3042687 RepID=UPI00249AA162|nr:polymer-forming cytoskeletal protein [Polyangium sp. 15x6]MDI3283588.1 polymer-forming cytoskeletal protein [Polyangium sp. 15x6]